MRTIAIANFKGGVGKTTTALNLTGALMLKKQRVLLVDLDPQCNASTACNINISSDKLGLRSLLMDRRYSVLDCAYPRGDYCDVIPADPYLYKIEQDILLNPHGRKCLHDKLVETNAYDYALLDCPPSLGALTQCALFAADDVLIPVDVGFFSVDGLARMIETIQAVCEDNNSRPALAGILATKFDSRTTLSEMTYNAIKEQGLPILQTVIRISVDIIRAQMDRSPVSLYAPGSHADQDYRSLADEIMPANVIPLRRRKG